MSAISEFGDLTLSPSAMPTTRSQSRKAFSQPSSDAFLSESLPASQKDQQIDDDQLPPPPPPDSDDENSEEDSDNSDDSSSSEEFQITHCTEKTAEEIYYAFEITPSPRPQTVRIGSPRTPFARPTCSCPSFRSDPAPCEHIFWLLDQIDPLPEFEFRTPSSVATIYSKITNQGLHSLALEKAWPYPWRRPLPAPVPHGTAPSSESENETDPIDTRLATTRDILSTFDAEGALPEDFLPSPPTPSSPLASDSLPQTLLNLSLHSPPIYKSLRAAVPKDHCASRYFDKLRSLTLSTLARAHTSPPAGLGIIGLDPGVSTLPRLFPREAATELRQIEAKVVQAAQARAPLTRRTKFKAFSVLLLALERVSSIDGDLFGLLFAPPVQNGAEQWCVDSLWAFADVARDALEALEVVHQTLLQRRASEQYCRGFKLFLDSVRGMPSKRRRSPDEETGAKRVK
ncbi:MAG: hypothetical protein M1814_001074 [Vezdaea aestivalis]|nr:MAG: hypothetical protein M1814_001074 [Vezdaea aestivalis]